MKEQGSTAHFWLACARLNYVPCREEVLGALHPNPMAMHMGRAPIYLGPATTSIKNNDNDNDDNNTDNNDGNNSDDNGNTHSTFIKVGEAAQPC